MAVYHFSMHMTVEQCEAYYTGAIKYVVVTCDDGMTLQLPIAKLRPFVTTVGIRGRFRLTTGPNNKFLSLEKTH